MEIFFGIITRKAIRLITSIETYIDGWNEAASPSPGPRPPSHPWWVMLVISGQRTLNLPSDYSTVAICRMVISRC